MDFFELKREKELKSKAPLASRMRPRNLEEYAGQEHLVGKDKPLYRMVKADIIPSMILYGPPGTGKTTLASIIAKLTKKSFKELSAVTAGVKDIRAVIKQAEELLTFYGNKTILFIDEIHRFNKSQQDALLPYVENGTIILIGATTENPFFEVNKALLSRSQIMELKPLSYQDIEKVIDNALNDIDRGFGDKKIKIENDVKEYLIMSSSGDARTALNSLELAILSSDEINGIIRLDMSTIKNSTMKKMGVYDKGGDEHYNTVSAFIKSMRGSDVDASLYYLAKMLESGEDIKFIARRIIIFASEDIGIADPNAINIAVSVFNAINIVGMPEARIILSQGVIYMSLAPKSNSSYKAIDRALKFYRENPNYDIPKHLKDSHYSGADTFNHGRDYIYPHDYPYSYVEQKYLPEEIKEIKFYQANHTAYEKKINERMKNIKKHYGE